MKLQRSKKISLCLFSPSSLMLSRYMKGHWRYTRAPWVWFTPELQRPYTTLLFSNMNRCLDSFTLYWMHFI